MEDQIIEELRGKIAIRDKEIEGLKREVEFYKNQAKEYRQVGASIIKLLQEQIRKLTPDLLNSNPASLENEIKN